MKTFELWLPTYISFKGDCGKTLGLPLPSETVRLKYENQVLDPMLFHAQDFAADAIAYYYSAKNKHMDALLAEGWPKSSLDSYGKTQSYKELWAREHAERLVEVIRSRSFKISAALKLGAM